MLFGPTPGWTPVRQPERIPAVAPESSNIPPSPAPLCDPEEIPAGLHPGTSSWSSDDWRGPFYSAGAKPADYLREYARHLPTVEIDSTFYRIPGEAMVKGWRDKTPPGFLFSAKVPRVVTHEKQLVDCDEEFSLFLARMEALGDRLGPLVFQFPYFAKGRDPQEYESGAEFRSRLQGFISRLPRDHRFAVEIRNDKWIDEPLLDLLSGHGVALVLVEYQTMPPIDRLLKRCNPVTADFAYIRFLGDHRKMDALVDGREKPWGSLAVDRTRETLRWVPVVRELLRRPMDVYAYFNNHFAGYAPGSVRLFLDLLKNAARGAD